MKFYTIAAATAAVLSAAACGSSSTAPQNGPMGGHSPQIEAVGSALGCRTTGGSYGSSGSTTCTFYFNPTPDTIPAGTAVSFKFDDVEHQIVWDTPGGPSNLPAAQNTTLADGTPVAGTYRFHCAIHPYMLGTLVVQ